MEKTVFFSYSADDIKANKSIGILLKKLKNQLCKYSIRYYDYKEAFFSQDHVSKYLKDSEIAIVIINEELAPGVNAEIVQINSSNNIKTISIFSKIFNKSYHENAASNIDLTEFLKKTKKHVIFEEKNIEIIAEEIVSLLLKQFKILLPELPYFTSYEKDIISIYKRKILNESNENDKELFSVGLPPEWPDIQMNSYFNNLVQNPFPEENWKDLKKDRVFSAALAYYFSIKCDIEPTAFCLSKNNLSFAEAGIRESIRDLFLFDQRNNCSLQDRNKIAIVVSGGIAPGINAVIHAIVQRHWTYYEKLKDNQSFRFNGIETCSTSVMGFKNGFSGLHNWIEKNDVKWGNINDNVDYEYLFDKSEQENTDRFIKGSGLKSKITSRYIDEAGSMLPTSRAKEFISSTDKIEKIKEIIEGLVKDKIKILYIIGGDGSMRFAHQLAIYSMRTNADVSIVTIPKTMDNDILWVWKPFGFESATIKASEFINQISWEIKSNPKLAIVQLFGSFSGFVASHAILGSRAQNCDLVIIPELQFSIEKICNLIESKLNKHRQSMLIISECAFPNDLLKYIDVINPDGTKCITDGERKSLFVAYGLFKEGGNNALRNRYGATKDYDEWSSPLLKLLVAVLERYAVEPNRKMGISIGKTITNKPQHLVRSIPPSPIDIIHAERLGFLAVDSAMAGCTDFMISQWLTEFCLVPLELVTMGGKQLPITGTFWKSVVAKTGQPEKLTKEDGNS